MKMRFLLVLVLSTIHISLLAQYRLQKIWETDTVTLIQPESVLYDGASKSIYVSCMGAGKIARIKTTGNILRTDWITGLDANKGCALQNGLFYTAEPTAIVVINAKKVTVTKRIKVPGAVMLNDVAIDAKGTIYSTDTRAGKVYQIENDNAIVYLENMPGANGLLTDGSDVYVLTSTTIEKVSKEKKVTQIASGFESGLDGIVKIAENEFIVSNYKGLLYYVNSNGTKQLLLDTRDLGLMSNDISYNPATQTLYVPSYKTSQVFAYKVIKEK
ncbi:ATP/GTP-binding protein [Phnomibacter sp. MR]|uniref:ATP/GTP-binding protein n=1 Tax=Phnomibacter sp. MR TaxID=3042318 RepID=UPI003A80BBD6